MNPMQDKHAKKLAKLQGSDDKNLQNKKKKVAFMEEERLESESTEPGMDIEHQGLQKRQQEHKTENELINEANQDDEMEWEDAYDDEFEKEDEVNEDSKSSKSDDYESEEEDETLRNKKGKLLVKKTEKQKKPKKDKTAPFVGTFKPEEGANEELEFENRAYDMLHRATTEFPCLSCDFLTGMKADHKLYKVPELQMKDTEYPLDLLAVAGSQASMPSKNRLYVLRLANLCQTKYDDDSEGGAEDEKDEIAEGNPIIMYRSIPVKGGINRVRSMMGYPIVALWTEAGQVKIYNVQPAMDELNQLDITKLDTPSMKGEVSESSTLLSQFKMNTEGYGLDWSPLKTGLLLSGSGDGKVNVFESIDEMCGSFTKANYFYSHHSDSVEDIQFSPKHAEAFATCSVDGYIKIVDMRVKSYKEAQISIKAHECDVNVISWNKLMPNLLASGADDGAIKVWDLRHPEELPITHIKWHADAITSLSWQPSDEWSLVATSADNRVSIWDFSVENNEQEVKDEYGVPEQVIFLHHGQEDVKDARWHPIYKDVVLTTALSGFNVFKAAINDDAASESDSEEENRLDIIPIS